MNTTQELCIWYTSSTNKQDTSIKECPEVCRPCNGYKAECQQYIPSGLKIDELDTLDEQSLSGLARLLEGDCKYLLRTGQHDLFNQMRIEYNKVRNRLEKTKQWNDGVRK